MKKLFFVTTSCFLSFPLDAVASKEELEEHSGIRSFTSLREAEKAFAAQIEWDKNFDNRRETAIFAVQPSGLWKVIRNH